MEWVKTTGSEKGGLVKRTPTALSMTLSLKAFENGKIILLPFPCCFVLKRKQPKPYKWLVLNFCI